MLALRNAVLGATDVTSDPRIAEVLATWNPDVEACGSSKCEACGNPANCSGTPCNWRYMECEDGSVVGVALSKWLFDTAIGQLLAHRQTTVPCRQPLDDL